jgi:predicted RNA-binding protein Jag
MKSVIEEGSSIAKAIDEAWNRAGRPAEFSVKVFQHPQKNFFGFTKVPAKIGIFFAEALPEKGISRLPQQQAQKEPRARVVQGTIKVEWTPELLKLAERWLKECLSIANLSHISVALKADRHILRITFSKPIVQNDIDTKRFFISFAHLLLVAVRTTSKLELKNFQVVLYTAS